MDYQDNNAKEVAIDFVEFIFLNDYEFDFGEDEWWDHKNIKWASKLEVFELYLKSKSND